MNSTSNGNGQTNNASLQSMVAAGREFNDFFERLFEGPHFGTSRGSGTAPIAMTTLGSPPWSAPASVWEADDTFHVEMDLPGVDPEAIDVTIEEGRLKIHATRKWDEEDRRYAHQERRSGEVTRTVALPDSIEPDSITADVRWGVLHVTMQKRPEVLPRKIEVKVNG